MREILFRGKRIDNGEWAEGWLVIKKDPVLEITYCFILAYGKGECFVTWYPVDPDTVGQYTGMTKNGKRIFEGDVVRCIRTHCDGKGVVGHIIFYECCFCVKTGINRPAMDLCNDFEIIGNIHDNPELMEGREE